MTPQLSYFHSEKYIASGILVLYLHSLDSSNSELFSFPKFNMELNKDSIFIFSQRWSGGWATNHEIILKAQNTDNMLHDMHQKTLPAPPLPPPPF